MSATASRRFTSRFLWVPPLLRGSPVLRRLAWTSFVSNIGSALQGIAFGYLAYARWGRAIAPVLVISAYTVAYAAISLPAGRWAQVRDRRRVAIASNLAKVVQCSRGSSTAPTTTPRCVTRTAHAQPWPPR